MLEQRFVQAREVARTLGIKTGTLAKWRQKGKGPKYGYACWPELVSS